MSKSRAPLTPAQKIVEHVRKGEAEQRATHGDMCRKVGRSSAFTPRVKPPTLSGSGCKTDAEYAATLRALLADGAIVSVGMWNGSAVYRLGVTK